MQATQSKSLKSQSNIGQQKTLDKVAEHCYSSSCMARLVTDTKAAIRNRLAHDVYRLEEISKQMGELSRSYHLYVDLMREREEHEKSAQKLAGLLGPHNYTDESTQYETLETLLGRVDEAPEIESLRESLSLWEAVEQFLRFVPEAKVSEIIIFLKAVGIEATRQAIESSVRTHPKTFHVTKRGREKFVSLKGGTR